MLFVGALLAMARLSEANGTFQQDGRAISAWADTNTQEDYNPSEHSLGEANSGAPRNLSVFILPHSHDDPGWVRTADQYFEFFIDPMYTTAVEALSANPERKFQAVEMVYFRKWYEGTTDRLRAEAQRLVRNGQIAFAVGGWVMPDEATVDYTDLIETMSLGQEWIYDTFEGARVRHGFQVDPFGASSSFAAISSKLGFESHLVARLNYYDKGWMQDNKQLEFVWRPSPSLYNSPEKTEIFTHIMDQYQYSAPGIPVNLQLQYLCGPPHNQSDCPGGGFYWDGDDSKPDAAWGELWKKQGYAVYPSVNQSNVEFYADFLVNNSVSRSAWFATDNLLWPFGTDFQHFNATAMFDSMDKIIAYVNKRNGPGQRYAGVRLQYASLGDYFDAVRAAKPSGWAVRGGGDFLPYSTLNCNGVSQKPLPGACSGNAGPQYSVSWPQVWSGFFTSHAQLKMTTRRAGRELRQGSLLVSLARLAAQQSGRVDRDASAAASEAVSTLRSAVGLLPHHDAVSGTMGPGCGNDPKLGFSNISQCASLPMGSLGNEGAVSGDYSKRLLNGMQAVHSQTARAAKALLGEASSPRLDTDSAAFKNALSAGKSGTVVASNSLGWDVERWVSVEVPSGVRAADVAESGSDRMLPAEVMPGGSLQCRNGLERVCAMAERINAYPASDANDDVVRSAGAPSNVLYFLAKIPALGVASFTVTPRRGDLAEPRTCPGNETVTVSNRFFSLRFEGGALAEYEDKVGGVTIPLRQELQAYTSFSAQVNQTSGSGKSASWSLTYTGARSGSYLLHPSKGAPARVSDAYPSPRIEVVRGRLVTEVRQWWSDSASQVFRVFNTQDCGASACGFASLQLGVGPLGGNRELIARFDSRGSIPTDAGQGSVFYSDDNGFQLQRRVFSPKRTFPDGSSQKIAPDASYTTALNFYPIVRSAMIRGAKRQLTVVAQQTGAVTSSQDGELQIMVHRRSLQDDSKGACQVFNDTSGEYATIPNDVSAGTTCGSYKTMGTCRADGCPAYAIPMNISTRVKPVFWLVAGAESTSERLWRRMSQELNNQGTLLYGAGDYKSAKRVSPLQGASLPPEVHLLTLQPRNNDMSKFILRLQHVFEAGPGVQPVDVDFKASGLCGLFGRGARVERTALNSLPLGQQPRVRFGTDEATRLDALGSRGGAAYEEAAAVADAEGGSDGAETGPADACAFRTRIWPQDIQTFLVSFEK